MQTEGNGLGRPLVGAKRPPEVPPSVPVAQVQGLLAERVVLSTPLDPFLPLKALVAYSGLSVRTLRTLLAASAHPLPHYRIGGKLLVRRSEYDAWAVRYRRVGRPDVADVVDDVLRSLR
jgi:hypothetical protein